MTSETAAQRRLQVDTRLLTGAGVLIGVGGALWLAGMSLGGVVVLRAAQQWIRQLDQPPSQLAKMKWQQLMTAKAAAAEAWKSGPAAKAFTAGDS